MAIKYCFSKMVCIEFHHILSLIHSPKMHRSPGQRESWRTTPPRCTEALDRESLGVPHTQDAQKPQTERVLAYHTPKMHRSPGQRESWSLGCSYHYTLDRFLLQSLQVNLGCSNVLKNSDPVMSSSTTQPPTFAGGQTLPSQCRWH